MLQHLANDGGFVALKRAAKDGDTETGRENMLYSRRLLTDVNVTHL